MKIIPYTVLFGHTLKKKKHIHFLVFNHILKAQRVSKCIFHVSNHRSVNMEEMASAMGQLHGL